MTNEPLTADKIKAICYDIAMPWTVLTKDRWKLAESIEKTVYQLAKQQNKQAIEDVKLLRAALKSKECLCGYAQCSICSGIKEALTATDRPEYKDA